MFNSLRSRLLLSYVVIIATALFIVTVALLAISASQTARVLPTLQQLSAISLGTRRELARFVEQGADLPAIQQALSEAAVDQNVRMLMVVRETGRIIYDSQTGGPNWPVIRLNTIERPRGELNNLDPSLPAGRYRAPDGTRWLISSQALSVRPPGLLLLLVARSESTFIQFFRATFLRPLLQAGLVALLLSVLLAVVISRSVARPLQRMAGAAESIAQREYDQQLPMEGPDEIQRVAGSFNSMTAQVSATQKAQRDFVANVSHDLKTPLTSIHGWSQALLDGTATTADQQRQAAGVIHDEAARMERMVEQLLDLAQIESGQLELDREPVDLAQLVSEVQHSFSLRAQEKEVGLSLDLQPVPSIEADHDRLRQAFANLVDNALTYTPTGGQVFLSLKRQGTEEVMVTVQDTGPGIPLEDLDRVFERFYQADKSRAKTEGQHGSGLGLAIVKELVEAHGGRISVQSRPGQGANFTVYMPIGSHR